MSVSVASVSVRPPPEKWEIGRSDFLYSGAFWGCPLPKELFRFIAYIC